jgi:NAD(P)-dependent dehydrogenase (short-subunit alcohol dehydrogenase family)
VDLQLQGRRALITGGSRGIGYSAACSLALEGVQCAIVARGRDGLDTAADRLRSETGGRVVPIQGDTSRRESVEAFVAEAVKALGGIDILVNSAARVAGDGDTFATATDEFVLEDFNTKFVGYLRTCRAVAPIMQSGGWGRIINISGFAARQAGLISAGARNAGVVHLTKTLSMELGAHGITVNAIYPSAVLTETVRHRYEAEAAAQGLSIEAYIERQSRRFVIGRLINPSEVGDLVAYLASPRAAAITGSVVAITGGAGRAVYY